MKKKFFVILLVLVILVVVLMYFLPKGGDVRIVCVHCGRDMTINRIKLENAIKKIIPGQVGESEDLSKT